MTTVITKKVSGMVLEKFAQKNPILLASAKSFLINPDNLLADKIVKSVKEAIAPLNGESKTVLGAIRRLFVSKNYTAHVAALYEIESTKHDKVENNDIAAQLYMKAAKETTHLFIKVNCYSRAFYCFISANKPDDALKAAKMLNDHHFTQGLATLYLEAAKLSEATGNISLAKDFYSTATEGDYYSVVEANVALNRLTPKVEFYANDSRFTNKDID